MAVLAGTMIGTAYIVGNMFGSSAKLRAAKAAQQQLAAARAEATLRSKAYEEEFSPFVRMSKGFLDEAATGVRSSQDYLQRLIAQTEGLDVGEGLSGADRIAYEDAAKLLNEQMVSTGNLRSGAAAFGQAQLLRRVVADASERRFSRQVGKLQLLFGGQGAMAAGANQFQSLAGTSGQIGLYGKQLSSQLLQAAMGLAPAQASMEVAGGSARAEFAAGAGGAPAAMMSFQNAFESSQQDQAYTDYLRAKTKAIS